MWLECTECGTEWGADLHLRLATERYRRAKMVGAVEWVCSAMELSRAMQKRGEYTEALRIGSEALPEMRRVVGPENSLTINAIFQLASIHSELGDHTAALRLKSEGLRLQRVVLGDDHPIVLAAIEDLAVGFMYLEQFDAALPLLIEHLATTRQTTVVDDDQGAALLVESLSNLANCYSRMAQHAQALPLAQEASENSLRVFGSHHGQTGYCLGQLGDVLYNIDDLAAAVPMLEQAVAVLTAASSYGSAHPVTIHFTATFQVPSERIWNF